ncbi:MAG: hypothetical protein A2Y62_19170 [Candidatus Fischerbacteria bacterium RBG_13_37_8]|uniref:GyrI-like small molecule binding domain-containing protein n=1 Tax=Candidatus Fischerbacteria bacterium RBG_13_37_8 TaxID=1817863 RepID=A0A1F5VQX2_9BACT|nr:MAG: hypothetical protein A2Y62_19170 [Candidatus Fischerbacteria bacterium RBG_13_37_8]
MPNQKMIVIELKGDPNVVAKDVFKKLYKTYYKLKIKDWKMVAPRARWTDIGLSKENWIGYYGIPVPDSVTQLPPDVNKEGPEVKLETWNYGEIAEILHIGPYSEETETVNKLGAFIEEKEYRITGMHEEEYLKGPGLWPVNPKNYYTIIRYTVEKMEQHQPDV